jgi:putative endonuclease
VYVLRCADGTLYTGVTNDLPRRLAQHAAGTGARYTRSRLPIALAHEERAKDRPAALRRENALKRLSREEKLALLAAARKAARATPRRGPPRATAAPRPRATTAPEPPRAATAPKRPPRGERNPRLTPAARNPPRAAAPAAAKPPRGAGRPVVAAAPAEPPRRRFTVPDVYRAIVKKSEKQAGGRYDVLVCGHVVPAATENTFRKARACPECRVRVQEYADQHAAQQRDAASPVKSAAP